MTEYEQTFINDINYLNSLKIDYFVAASTLLGIIRSNKLIENDKEIDVCMLGEDITDDLLNQFKADGWNVEVYKCREKYGLIYLINQRSLDFYGNKDVSKGWMTITPLWVKHGITYTNICGDDAIVSPNLIDKSKWKTMSCYGVDFKTPPNPKRYLRFAYGANWKTPNPDWHWTKSKSYKLYDQLWH